MEFVSGKKLTLNQMAIIFVYTQLGICIHAELDEYRADFFYQKVQSDVVSCKAVLTPKTDSVKDKIRKITSLKAFGFYSQDALLIKQDFTNSGIIERQKKDKKGISENYLSIYEKDRQDNAVTFTSCLQAKFYSHVAYEQRKNGILFSLTTIVPISFVGKIEREEWKVHLHSPTVDALAQSVQGYPKTNEFVKPIGWSTWDYYFTSATENDVKANVDFIARNKMLKEKVRYTILKYADFHYSRPILSGGEGLPEIWKKDETGSVYVFNFGDEAKEYVLKLENGRYYDIFENMEYVVSNGTLCLSIQPHDCICLYIGVGNI